MNANIAIPHENGMIFRHFGRATEFKIYKLENNQIISSQIVSTDGAAHEELALWLVWHDVHAVVCGDIGPGMQGALAVAGIAMFAGVDGSTDDAINKLIKGELVSVQQANCGGGGCGESCHNGGCHGCHGKCH